VSFFDNIDFFPLQISIISKNNYEHKISKFSNVVAFHIYKTNVTKPGLMTLGAHDGHFRRNALGMSSAASAWPLGIAPVHKSQLSNYGLDVVPLTTQQAANHYAEQWEKRQVSCRKIVEETASFFTVSDIVSSGSRAVRLREVYTREEEREGKLHFRLLFQTKHHTTGCCI